MLTRSKYIDVILPLPLKGAFTYCTDSQDLLIGQRVVVPFGARKLYTGIVKCIHNNKPTGYHVKSVLAILEEPPIVNQIQIKFWDWIANYYMCNLGDVMNAALPSSLKLASESKLIIHEDFDGDIDYLSTDEYNLLNVLLHQEKMSIHEISKLINIKNIFSLVDELIRKEIIQIKEDLHDKFKEKEVQTVRFIISNKKLEDIQLTSKQQSFVTAFLRLENQTKNKRWIVSDLLKEFGFSRSILNALVDKGVFSVKKEVVSRLLKSSQGIIKNNELVDFQKKALDEINKSFKKKDVCLLHGVTSSGKTELYIRLIQQQLQKGKQVLYLLPEIALTTQIIKRLQKIFGDKVGVTHSHLNNSERVEIWKAVCEKDGRKVQFPIMLGARSSLFLPFDNLGLIIIDEEHDSSFKQHQPAPRYHARDAGIYLGNLHQAKVLLGSATPCLESYFNAKNKKYGLVNMYSRFQDIALPDIQTIDIRKAHLKKQMKFQFSNKLLQDMQESLDNSKQIILFQNRRGYSPLLSCETCSYTPGCKQCDVSLTYHKSNKNLRCHYCGYSEDLPDSCPSCSSKNFIDKGFGTEQIEESLIELFPENIIKRMDHDTTRGKNSYQNIITDFEEGRIDILVGTQMISKGLDFDNVSLVGILNADNMLHFPDFRAYERAFQLIMQVAGRAGRKGKQGKVLIQTYDENNQIFKMIKENTFDKFIQIQAKERALFSYPPYNRLVRITLKDKNQRKLDDSSLQLSLLMRKSFGNRVLGPEYPAISKVRNYYHKDILLKIEQKGSIVKAKEILRIIIQRIQNQTEYKSVRFIVDVDPV